MKKNKNTRIIGRNIMLVPYEKKHVLRYHEWMKSSELQHFTGSEPLSLEKEYKMQTTWAEDEDKCTFIILDKDLFQCTADEVDAMIGDTNLFFNNTEDPHIAEVEIMIADPNNRGKRRGWEAVILMLLYGINELNVNKYMVKITLDNGRSITMFEKLHFQKVEESAIFKEVTFCKTVTEEWKNWLHSETVDAIQEKVSRKE